MRDPPIIATVAYHGRASSNCGHSQVFLCHCSTCRIQSGSFNIPFAALPRAQVDLDTGRLSRSTLQVFFIFIFLIFSTRFRTSAFATRLFCSACGTFVAMDYDAEAYTVS